MDQSPVPSSSKVSDQEVALSSQLQSGSREGQPGVGWVCPAAESTGTSHKPFQSLPSGGDVSRSAVSDFVRDPGAPGASGARGGPFSCPDTQSGPGVASRNPQGLPLAPLVVSGASTADLRSGPQSSFPLGQSLPGSSHSVASPGFPLTGNPSFTSGYGSVDLSGGFRPPFPPCTENNPVCSQGFPVQPNQPVNGLGYQNPGSYGSAPYMSGFASGGSGGYPSTFGQGYQPQTQAGQFGNSWGHSHPMGPPACPPGFGFGPYVFPQWNPWGLVSPSQQRFGGLLVPPPQQPSGSGALSAGTSRRHRASSSTASVAVSAASQSRSRVESRSRLAFFSHSKAKGGKRLSNKRSHQESVLPSLEEAPLATSSAQQVSQTLAVDPTEPMDCEGSRLAADVLRLSPNPSEVNDFQSEASSSDGASSDDEDGVSAGAEEEMVADASNLLSGMRALRADVALILGEKDCPPPSASLVPEATTLLSSVVPSKPAPRGNRTLPEGTIVSSALAAAQARVVEKNSSSTRAPGFPGLQLAVSDLSEINPSDYAVHDGKLAPHPAKLESRELSSWPGKLVDQVVFHSKEHHKVERMLRLSMHILSYVDFFTVSLYRLSGLPEDRLTDDERQDMQGRLMSALNAALRAVAALQSSLLANVLLARRCSVLGDMQLGEPYRSRLLTAPFTGPTLFSGVLPDVQKDLREDSVASDALFKRSGPSGPSSSQGSGPAAKKSRPNPKQRSAWSKPKSSFKAKGKKGKGGKKPPSKGKRSS